MKRKNKDSSSSSSKIAIKFFAFVFIVIFVSLIFKGINIVINSKFDGQNRFTISVASGKDFEIISFSPKSQSISVLKIEGKTNSDINRLLEIPIDGDVKTTLSIKEGKMSDLTAKFILNFRNLKTNLTIIDILRLYLFARTIPDDYVYNQEIDLSMDVENIDKIVMSLFRDEEVGKENQSIKIVNGTTINGLGNRLGRLVNNIGGSVVIVVSSDNQENESTISYSGKKTYTLKKLSKILGFKIIKLENKAIADIVIIIGKDSLAKLNF